MIVIILLIVLLGILLFELYLTTKINKEVDSEIREIEESFAIEISDINQRISALSKKIATMREEDKDE